MSSTAILLITIVFSIVTVTATTPITMGALILIQATLASIALMSLASSWFSMMLFIIYIGGLLVMFSYFIALGPNQHLFLLPTLIFSLSLFFIMSSSLISWPMKISIINIFYTGPQPSLAVYAPENFLILIFLVIILFFALILVVKIANRAAGPLRPFNYV